MLSPRWQAYIHTNTFTHTNKHPVRRAYLAGTQLEDLQPLCQQSSLLLRFANKILNPNQSQAWPGSRASHVPQVQVVCKKSDHSTYKMTNLRFNDVGRGLSAGETCVVHEWGRLDCDVQGVTFSCALKCNDQNWCAQSPCRLLDVLVRFKSTETTNVRGVSVMAVHYLFTLLCKNLQFHLTCKQTQTRGACVCHNNNNIFVEIRLKVAVSGKQTIAQIHICVAKRLRRAKHAGKWISRTARGVSAPVMRGLHFP